MTVREGDFHDSTEYATLEIGEERVGMVYEVIRRKPFRTIGHVTIVCEKPVDKISSLYALYFLIRFQMC